MEEKYNALVVRTTSYRDNDIMLTLFTLEEGLISACLRGAKKPNAKLKFAGEVFCFGEFVLVNSSGRRTVKEVNQIDSFYGLRLDSDKYFCANVIIEFVNRFMLENIKSFELFLLCINALKVLSKTDVNCRLLLVSFIIKALKSQGYETDFSACAICGGIIEKRAFFSFTDGISVCLSCANELHTEIRISTYNLLRDLSSDTSSDFDYLQNLSFDEATLLPALRFVDFALKQMADVTIKSLQMFIQN